MAMAYTTSTHSQFAILQIPKFSVRSSRNGYVTMKLSSYSANASSIDIQTTKSFLFTSCPQTQRRYFGLKKLICEASSGLEVSVADSEDTIVVKKVEIVVESQDSDKIQVRVDLTGVETQRVFDTVLTNLARTAPPIPGFRKDKGGKTTKVPKSYLLGVLGEERVNKFVLQEIVRSSIAQYVKKENLNVKEDKINTIQSAEELKEAFKPGTEFGFSAVIELESSEVDDDQSSDVDEDQSSEVENIEVEISN